MARRFISIAALALSACASGPAYVGHPVQDAMLALGPPAGVMTTASGAKAYQWRRGHAVGMVLPSGLVATRDRDCVLTLTVDGNEKVIAQAASSRRC